MTPFKRYLYQQSRPLKHYPIWRTKGVFSSVVLPAHNARMTSSFANIELKRQRTEREHIKNTNIRRNEGPVQLTSGSVVEDSVCGVDVVDTKQQTLANARGTVRQCSRGSLRGLDSARKGLAGRSPLGLVRVLRRT